VADEFEAIENFQVEVGSITITGQMKRTNHSKYVFTKMDAFNPFD
jgi:hypothetical protein